MGGVCDMRVRRLVQWHARGLAGVTEWMARFAQESEGGRGGVGGKKGEKAAIRGTHDRGAQLGRTGHLLGRVAGVPGDAEGP